MANSVKRTEPSAWIFGVGLGVLYVIGVLVFRFHRSVIDEYFHYAQVTLFYSGFWRVVPQLTTIPGYHAVVALILRVVGNDHLDTARFVHASLCLIAIAGFFALRRRLWPGTETAATAQFVVLPIMAPLLFVVYTDVPAVALLLWATWAVVSGRSFLSALLLCLLVLVRQHEIVLGAFLVFLAARPPNGWRQLPKAWRESFHRAWPFALPLLLFFAFWRWNGTISLSPGQAAFHPDVSFHTGNVFMALLAAGLLLPAQTAIELRHFYSNLRERPWLLLFPAIAFMAFWFGFRANNPLNGHFYSDYFRHYLPIRLAAALIITCVACSLWRIRLRPAESGLALGTVAAVFLAASWLIELRYLIPPFALWLAMREHRYPRVEYATLALWIILAVLMTYLAFTSRFFV
ncbi:MAG: hypothetical protein ABJB01_06940 [Rudaea sp.]